MIDYSAIEIKNLIIHKVGNKSKDENCIVSNNLINIDEELATNIINYCFTPFSKQVEILKFHHHSDLNLNPLYSFSKKLFNNDKLFQQISENILDHLYNQSNHPHIKIGELVIVYFSDMIFEDQLTEAIGVYKFERRQKFFNFTHNSNSLNISIREGVSSKRIDKGCLIINSNSDDGFRVMSIDNNNYDTEYWKNRFLNTKFVQDMYYHTSNYIDFVKQFSEDVIENKKGKDEQIAFLNKSINYLSNNDDVNIRDFANSVIDDRDLKNEFLDYKTKFEQKHDTQIKEEFEVSQSSIKKKKRAIKSLIKLDTNIQIKLDNKDPETNMQYLEKGYDKVRGMHYYKVYYNNESS